IFVFEWNIEECAHRVAEPLFYADAFVEASVENPGSQNEGRIIFVLDSDVNPHSTLNTGVRFVRGFDGLPDGFCLSIRRIPWEVRRLAYPTAEQFLRQFPEFPGVKIANGGKFDHRSAIEATMEIS